MYGFRNGIWRWIMTRNVASKSGHGAPAEPCTRTDDMDFQCLQCMEDLTVRRRRPSRATATQVQFEDSRSQVPTRLRKSRPRRCRGAEQPPYSGPIRWRKTARRWRARVIYTKSMTRPAVVHSARRANGWPTFLLFSMGCNLWPRATEIEIGMEEERERRNENLFRIRRPPIRHPGPEVPPRTPSSPRLPDSVLYIALVVE
jgi:hypothetical protein